MIKKIIIVSGDPESINSEIIYKSWKKINKKLRKNIYFISNYELLSCQFKKLKYNIKIEKVTSVNQSVNSYNLKVIDIKLKFQNPFSVEKKDASRFIKNSLNLAHKLGIKKNVSGIINCPIDKKYLNKNFSGVTEFFASKCSVNNNSEVMLIYSKKLAVSPITTHINIKDVSKKLKLEIIINKIKTLNSFFKKNLKKKPKIAILGLNPHNAEFRYNSEEKRIIIPAIKKIKKVGINLNGPFAADTLFVNIYKKYDVIVGMFHDQVITPFKTLYHFDAINITLGLKYLRTTPDHGTAKNIIGKNKANPLSLVNCIYFISKFGK